MTSGINTQKSEMLTQGPPGAGAADTPVPTPTPLEPAKPRERIMPPAGTVLKKVEYVRPVDQCNYYTPVELALPEASTWCTTKTCRNEACLRRIKYYKGAIPVELWTADYTDSYGKKLLTPERKVYP